ncbi:hypothetical protein ACSYAD_32500 [Acaryochloris marina NIES-2412]|uniref:hypothetical protein n=1 Tax=Acaryochloris marina TaxID=155978 RepID=UPI004059BDA7
MDLEKDIHAALKTGAEVVLAIGTALDQIRDRKLYKAEFRTFEAYVNKKFSMKRSRAYHLISAARVIKELQSHFKETELPKNESVVRPLMKFKEQQLIEIWQTVLNSYKDPGRADVEAVIKKLQTR